MADKLTELIVAALTRAAADPAGVPLYAAKSGDGLFPNTAAAKTAAKRCLDERWLHLVASALSRKPMELAAVTPAGLDWLLARQSPKAILEDLVRVLEAKQVQVQDLVAESRRMADSLAALKATLNAVLPRTAAATIKPDVESAIVQALEAWSRSAGAAEDCPLPQLHQSLSPACSLGAFHDALRRLHAAHRIYLHPWTGPLYACPQPAFSVLIGHEVAWYASLRTARVLPQTPAMTATDSCNANFAATT